MANERVEEFLDLYKKLEQLLKEYYGNDSGRYESVVARYEHSRAIGKLRDEISAVREIRNLLQHNPKINGSYVAEPSDEIMKALRQTIHNIEHPKLAIEFGVREAQIYKTTMKSGLLKVIRVMKERGFNHVPVIENNRVCGIVSTYAVFEFVTEQGMQILTEDTKVGDMDPYLSLEKNKNEYFLFLPKTATFNDADEAFEKRDSKKRRLSVIFITEHGRQDEPMLAILTPWSVVGK